VIPRDTLTAGNTVSRYRSGAAPVGAGASNAQSGREAAATSVTIAARRGQERGDMRRAYSRQKALARRAATLAINRLLGTGRPARRAVHILAGSRGVA
jgi:hypothetical protein